MNIQKMQINWNFNSFKYPIIITLSFFLVISYITFFQNDYLKEGDFFQYYLIGKQIINGDGKNTIILNAGPGGPVLYASLDLFFNDPFLTAKIIGLLSGTGVVFVSYYIIRNIFDYKIALVGQLFVAFNPKIIVVSLQALNEYLSIFLIFLSFYFITKKNLKLSDVAIVGVLLGISSLIRFQPILILFSFAIFLIIQNTKIKKNLVQIIVIMAFFLIAFSPSLIYNYTTHGILVDSNPNYNSLVVSKYTNHQWIEKMKSAVLDGSDTIIFNDFDLFLQNYFYNLFYNNPNKLFNFNTITNVSIIPTIPFLGLIPIIGGLVYSLNIKLNKLNIITLVGITIVSSSLVFILGDIQIHFFAIIITPLLVLIVLNIRNIQKNLIPVLISPIIFFLLISIVPLTRPEHLFPIWIVVPVLSALFFVRVIPNIYQKIKLIKPNKFQLTSPIKIVVVIIIFVLLINFGHSYKTLELYLYEETYDGVWNEIIKSFHRDEPLVKRGLEIKQISDVLSEQPEIENSYVMAPSTLYLYYVDTKILLTSFQEGIKNDPIEKFITRENWSYFDIFMSNLNSYPSDRHGINNPIPDYLIYGPVPINNWKYDINTTQYNDLKILSDPNNPKSPSNFEVLYISNKTGAVVYKIHHEQ